MNSCGLRIAASDSKKIISGITFKQVVIPDNLKYLAEKHELSKYFMNSSAEEQVTAVKKILNNVKEHCDDDVVCFLVVTYLYADVKHPVKCILTRFVTKNGFIQESFEASLTRQLLSLIDKNHSDYKNYGKVIDKLASCSENFPVGAMALKNLEKPLMKYITDSLTCCISTLSDKLTPTGRNELFGLTHTVLRLLLYVIQKMDEENISKFTSIFEDVRSSLKHLMFDDSPMDTKSVCGILFVTMHVLENGSNSWIEILNSKQPNAILQDFLSNDSSKLSLYSAIATVISMKKLYSYIDHEPAIIKLTDNILDLGDRYSSESIFILGVARTIVQISKGLDKSGDSGLYLLHRLFIFIWSNLEHTTDSIQHLSAQILTNVIKYCAHLRKQGNETAMNELIKNLSSLERTRKSFYLSLTALTDELGVECVLNIWPNIITETINVLHIQAIQASATTSLETLLRHSHTDAHGVYVRWVEPALRCVRANCGCVRAVAGLLRNALGGDSDVIHYILPYIKNISENTDPRDLICVLMLSSVLRQAGLVAGTSGVGPSENVLRGSAIHTSEEIRILSISLIVESPRSTETFTEYELDFLLWFISYNINVQAPHFRQLVLSLMKKFFKRLEQSYRTLTRENQPNSTVNKSDFYLHFSDKLTDLCFENLLPGGNYNRRHIALQLLVWLGNINFEGVDRQNFHILKKNNKSEISDRLYTLLNILGDSYESNKELALQLLYQCPSDELYSDKYESILHLESVIEQASSMKPTECVTAGYKLKLLTKKLSKYIDNNSTIPSEVSFTLLKILIAHLERQVRVCSEDIVRGARGAPMYGVLHCVALALENIDISEWSDSHTQTCVSLVSLCSSVCECAGVVLCSAAPEGHLPRGHDGKIRFNDGSEVTAQMVLLCAWRSVKEVSLILSLIVSKVTNSTNREIKISLVKEIGNKFLQLLTETKHRGAFEQVYVGFSRMLKSLWCDSEPQLNELPKRWLSELMIDIESGQSSGRLCSTRRSAGLPFMIQALVVSQLQVSPCSFPQCAASLLRTARTAALETRCHSMNVLRALYRSAAVGGAGGGGGVGGGGGDGGVGEALQLAVQGCESDAWVERNSSTLLFSALMVRVFGVQRSRHQRLSQRNKMTGRIFFLRYPQLYDFMLDKLQESSFQEGLHPGLYPVLLLLARLYPSALEGSVSILKLCHYSLTLVCAQLVCFVPPLVRCARQPALPLRRLAARALPPLLPATRYLPHLEEMFSLLSDRKIKRNFCHGILLQIIKLIDERSDSLIDEESNNKLATLIESSSWILQQSISVLPCYLLANEYIKLVHIILWKFNSLIKENFMNYIRDCLTKLLFNKSSCKINPGKELCLSNAVYLYLILNIYNISDVCPFIFKCLSHETYEVVLAVLNYLLLVYNELEPEDMLQEHLKEKSNRIILETLKKDNYIETLCDVLKKNNYLECTTKCLQVLTLEPNTQKHIVLTKSGGSEISDEQIMIKLFHYIQNEHENFTHIYLKSLTGFLGEKLDFLSHLRILEALRIIFSCSLSDNSEETRTVVIEFFENNFERLLSFKFNELSNADSFEARATLWSTCVSLLEDEDTHTRTRIAHAITRTCDVTRIAHTITRTCDVTRIAHAITRTCDVTRIAHAITRTCDVTCVRNTHVIPSRAMEFLVDYIQVYDTAAVAMLAVIALINFDCEVCLMDDVIDECRVFDHNEKYNTNLEEAVWSRACADAIKNIYNKCDIAEELCDIIDHVTYRQTFIALCSDHVDVYKSIVKDNNYKNDGNPKVNVFVKRLRL